MSRNVTFADIHRFAEEYLADHSDVIYVTIKAQHYFDDVRVNSRGAYPRNERLTNP